MVRTVTSTFASCSYVLAAPTYRRSHERSIKTVVKQLDVRFSTGVTTKPVVYCPKPGWVSGKVLTAGVLILSPRSPLVRFPCRKT